MKRLIVSKEFFAGFLGGVFFFICINIIDTIQMLRNLCHHCVEKYGFPFNFYESLPMVSENFLWFGLIGDILFAIVFSFIVGLFFKYLWSKVSNSYKIK